ncbi:MAG: YeiH family protein [Actinobacteria bacterium]|nr:YeiH family protein [Actinomycetota bacterium]
MALAQHAEPAKKRSILLTSEDWWSVYLGLGLLVITVVAFAMGSPLNMLKVAVPIQWPKGDLMAHFAANIGAYLSMYVLLAVLTGFAVAVMGGKVGQYLLSFTVLFVAALVILTLGSEDTSKVYGLEYPFWALVVGLIIGNLWEMPSWFRAAAGRTEFYIKTSIVLLGVNLPFTTVVSGGGWGFLEAITIVGIGFIVAFIVAKRLGFDNPFASILGAGGSVCGISAAIAVGGSVKANSKHIGYICSLVMVYALVLIFLMPFIARTLHLTDAVAGAWIGGSELADAAGLAAAAMVSDKAAQAFTLVKLNRDVMIGVLAFILAVLSVTQWEKKEGQPLPSPMIIWDRFPKFVIAFLLASFLSTMWNVQYGKDFAPAVTANLNNVRTWLFTLAFLCIGCNTKIEDIRSMGWRPITAFTVVVVVNLVVGFIMANLLFGGIIAKPL